MTGAVIGANSQEERFIGTKKHISCQLWSLERKNSLLVLAMERKNMDGKATTSVSRCRRLLDRMQSVKRWKARLNCEKIVRGNAGQDLAERRLRDYRKLVNGRYFES